MFKNIRSCSNVGKQGIHLFFQSCKLSSILTTLSSTCAEGVLEEAGFIPITLVVVFLKIGVEQALNDNPLTRPGRSLPNITPTGLFGDISDAVFGFININYQFFPAKTTYVIDVILKNLNNN